MNAIELKAELVTREKKDGSGTYQVVLLFLTDTYPKQVWLEEAEKEIMRLSGIIKPKDNQKENQEEYLPF